MSSEVRRVILDLPVLMICEMDHKLIKDYVKRPKNMANLAPNSNRRSISSWLHDAISQHRIGDFDEACNIGTLDVIDISVVVAVLDALLVDARHNRA